jgi:acetoin utilization deacetylase AcuC-like enzyme
MMAITTNSSIRVNALRRGIGDLGRLIRRGDVHHGNPAAARGANEIFTPMRVFYTDRFVLPLPPGHTFPMTKYRLLRDRVEAAGLLRPGELAEPPAADDALLELAHDPDYVRAMSAGTVDGSAMKKVGFPWSPELVERSRRSSGATVEAAFAALADGVAVNLAGGTHHAFRGHGEGYCLFNDSVIAVRALQRAGKVRRAVVLDLDVHQGNGTAALCRGDDSTFTLSVHGAKNYPLRKETSDLDVELPDRTADREYLDAVEWGLTQALAAAGADFAVYLAGADPFEHDRLGRLAVSKAGLAERDRLVFDALTARGLPVVVTMAGGYAHDVTDTVDIQFATVIRAIRLGRG